MAKKTHGGTPAIDVLVKSKTPHKVYEYEHSREMSDGYALDTANILGVDAKTVFKTLLTLVDGKPVVAVVPADHRLNLKNLAKAAGGKRAQMMEPAAAERLTGYVTGGISPLGQHKRLPTVIDAGAQELPAMLVSGGKRSISVSLAPADLAALTRATFAAIIDHA
ncbi:Cys-tRNA(Pro)/Cys-tRNA(Cys) deacylase [Arcanobacterium wilhelmae]|uniref:Cys-tRNA(Pro)/Cys-tRNA(Cys) deacylase n=1 Tax=Arcanobacterium wilhelmae TaxID=1803177 RepID=A0ABT9N9Y8_9ACTO|nr:Cys-tRNA(Pro) deacylase [Arcanobacterium wilhelmae]MDP9800221.1 Cys-tRNA(Pro)/Cys-tRNA(Cys) deacylase [Arcanobacterium wilhelmae]WFN89660.1 Cys-tRNA(Pro) deacylase [Arcanobacterium wilhelmae]